MDYKINDVVYYDELELNNRITTNRYHVCVIKEIKDNKLWGKWFGLDDLPSEEKIRKMDAIRGYSWMSPREVHLLFHRNKNRRIVR